MAQMKYGNIIENGNLIKKESEKGKLRMMGLKSKVKVRQKDGKVIERTVPLQYRGSWTLNIDETSGKDYNNIWFFTEKFIYKISKEKAYQKGTFKTLGGEKNIIIPCQHFQVEDN